MIKNIVSFSIQKLCLFGILAIIGLAIFGLGVFQIIERNQFLYVFDFFLIMTAFVFLIYKFSDSKYKWLWVLLIGIGIIIRIVYAGVINPLVINDEAVCLDAAQMTVKGDFSWTNLDYFQRWAYQIPFVLYESAVLKIFGTIRALYIFNGIFSIFSCLLVYLIIKKVYNMDVAIIVTAIYSCYSLLIFKIGNLYNHIIAVMFLLIGIYFFADICIKKEALKPSKGLFLCVMTGLFLGIGNLFRTEVVIVLLGVEFWFVYNFILNINKQRVLSLLACTLLCMIVTYTAYKAVNMMADFTIIHTGISPNGIKNGCIYWFFICGLTPDSYGMYSEKYIDIVFVKDKHEQFLMFKSIIHEIFSTQSPMGIIKFFFFKEFYMWGYLANCCIFSEGSQMPKIIEYTIMVINHCFYICVFLLSLIGIGKKQFSNFVAFLAITFLGFLMVYMIKETSATYRYFTINIVILLSASGINVLMQKCKFRK